MRRKENLKSPVLYVRNAYKMLREKKNTVFATRKVGTSSFQLCSGPQEDPSGNTMCSGFGLRISIRLNYTAEAEISEPFRDKAASAGVSVSPLVWD